MKQIIKDKVFRYIGFALFCLGVMISISAGAKVPIEGSKWPDTMTPFIVGLIIGITGLILWHKEERRVIKNALKEAPTSEENPVYLIKEATEALKNFETRIDNMNEEETLTEADRILSEFILPFAEVRQMLVSMMGMSAGSDVLIQIAFGERYLNRVWSAASDHHLEEARNSLPSSVAAFVKANEMVEKVLK